MDGKTARGRRALPRPVWIGVLLLGLCACRGPRVAKPEDLSNVQLVDQMRERFAAEDFERTVDVAEEVLARTTEPELSQEALFMAAESQLALENRKKSFRHYETLLEDYPYSKYLPRIEANVFGIGEWYLAREPSKYFQDLFSGRPFGSEVMRQFTIAYPFSERADDAVVAVADYFFSREEFDFAADKYALLVERYPRSEWYDYASYRVGLSHLRFSRGAGYDTSPLNQARNDFLRYLSQGQLQNHREDAEAKLLETEELLALSELDKAKFYLLREQDRGARIHFANVVLAYPRTEAAKQAREELETRGWDVSLNSMDTLPGQGQ